MPSIHRVHSKLEGSGLEILLIDIRESPSQVKRTVRERGYTLPVLLDRDGTATRAYRVWGTPGVYLIDSDGYLIANATGPRDWDSAAGIRVLRSLGK